MALLKRCSFFNGLIVHLQDEVFENKAKVRRPLPGLPDVLAASNNDDKAKDAADQSPQTIYRVVGGRKHVQKSEASMQTEPSLAKQGCHSSLFLVLNSLRCS